MGGTHREPTIVLMAGFVRVAAGMAALTSTLAFGAGVAGAQSPGDGTISGVVRDDAGNAFEGVCVSAYGLHAEVADSGDVNTDGNGRYEITGLDPGTYQVSFGFSCAPGGDAFLSEQWNNAHNWQDIDPVEIGAGSRVTGIDAQADRPAKVSGVVTRRDGAPVAGICVAIRSATPGMSFWRDQKTDASGAYGFEDIPPGEHELQYVDCDDEPPVFLSRWFTDSPNDPFTLGSGEARRADLVMQVAPSISGRVTMTDGAPVENACVMAHPVGGLGNPVARTDADGRYTILKDLGQLQPGTPYVIGAFDCQPGMTSPEYSRFVPTSWGGDPFAPTPVVLAEEEQRTGMDIVVRRAGFVTGQVVNAAGEPLQSICVQNWANGASQGLLAITQSNGRFRSVPQLEGTYKLRFIPCPNLPDKVPQSPGYAPEFWDDSPTEGTAEIVTVEPGVSTPHLEVVMTAAGPDPCVVPSLQGKRIRKAEKRLLNANCEVGEVTRKKAKGRGKIIESDPPQGAKRRFLADVDLALAR